MKTLSSFVLMLGLLYANSSFAIDVSELQHKWAVANYKSTEAEQEKQFEALISEAEAAVSKNPQDPELLIWDAIIKSTYAGKASGLTALSLVKAARNSLERAMEIDDMAMQGSAYTSLGALYYQVPGWPIAFGSDKKARQLLEKALTINPDGIDSNYFYGDFLVQQKKYEAAKKVLQKALEAAPRPGRELADEGRRQEIQQLLASIED